MRRPPDGETVCLTDNGYTMRTVSWWHHEEGPRVTYPDRVLFLDDGTGDDFEVVGVVASREGDLWALSWDDDAVIFVSPADLWIDPPTDDRPIFGPRERLMDVANRLLGEMAARMEADLRQQLEQPSPLMRLLERD